MKQVSICVIFFAFSSVLGYGRAGRLGGYERVSEDDIGKIAATIKELELCGPLADAELIEIDCAYYQVVAGENYNVTASFQTGDSTKVCELKYFVPLKGPVSVESVNCDVSDNCATEQYQ